MGTVWKFIHCLLVGTLLSLPASAQSGGLQVTPLRFQSSPIYHPPSYYPYGHQRLLLQLGSTASHVFRNTEVDLDSTLIVAGQWLGIGRLPVVNEGFEKQIFLNGLVWFDRREPDVAIRSLPAAHGVERLRGLVLLGAYYALQPAIPSGHRDSALLWLQAARAESHLLKESKWDRQALCLLGKYFVQGDSLNPGNACFDECIRECRQDSDRLNEAKAWAWRGLYTHYSAATTQDRITSLEKARTIYRELGDAEGEINVLTNIGYLDVSDIQLKKGEQLFKETLRLEDSIGFAYTHYTTDDIAMVTSFEGRFGEPLSYTYQTVKTAETLRDSLLWGSFYVRLSILYELLNDKVAEVATWAQKAFDRFLVEKGDAYTYISASPLIDAMVKRHESAGALTFLKNLARQQPPRSISANERYLYLVAHCYEQLKQYDSAEVYTLEAVGQTHKLALLHGTIFNHYADWRLGKLYFHMGKYFKAKSYFHRYLHENLEGLPLAITLDAYEYLAKMDSLSRDYRGYARHLKTYIDLQNSNINTQGQRQAEELAVRFETERKERDIQLRDQRIMVLQQADQLRQSHLRQTMLIERMTAAGVGVLLIVAVLLIRQNRQRKRMNGLIEQKNEVITDKNEMLVKVLAEKEWLLKEVNHRVKNNLQTVVSLLETQGRYLKNDALEAIISSQHRVYAMLLLHQKISQAENNNAIEMSGYLDDIIQYLRESFDNPEGIQWQLDVQSVQLGLRQAVPIALIVNESVTNALKHAFPAGREGVVSIHFGQEEEQVYLSISDNGVGISRPVDEAAEDSLGIGLMNGLSRELRGTIHIHSYVGTTVLVRFDLEKRVRASYPA